MLDELSEIIAAVFYLIYLIAFVVYSNMGIKHLHKYGYTGDDCEKVIKIYKIIATIIIMATIIIFIT